MEAGCITPAHFMITQSSSSPRSRQGGPHDSHLYLRPTHTNSDTKAHSQAKLRRCSLRRSLARWAVGRRARACAGGLLAHAREREREREERARESVRGGRGGRRTAAASPRTKRVAARELEGARGAIIKVTIVFYSTTKL